MNTKAFGMKKDQSKDWGVVQEFVLESDTDTGIKSACEIAFTYHNGADMYEVEKGSLILHWFTEKDTQKLPYPLESTDAAQEFVRRWLDNADYPEEQPDTDGSVKKGYRIEICYNYLMKVTPTWIVYSK